MTRPGGGEWGWGGPGHNVGPGYARRPSYDALLIDSLHQQGVERIPFGEFTYGEPVEAVEFGRVPEMDRSDNAGVIRTFTGNALRRMPTNPDGSLVRVPGDSVYADHVMGVVNDFVQAQSEDGPRSQVIFKELVETWERSDMRAFVNDILGMYNVNDAGSLLRSDPDNPRLPLGTSVYMGFAHGERILLVDRPQLYRVEGVMRFHRQLEIGEVTSKEEVLRILNRLSLPEKSRVDDVLHALGASREEVHAIEGQFSRVTVQSDQDVKDILDAHRRRVAGQTSEQSDPPDPRRRVIAALSRVTAMLPVIRRTKEEAGGGAESAEPSAPPDEPPGRHRKKRRN